MSTRTALSRPTILLAAIAAIALSMLYLISPVSAANFNAGQNGHPYLGPYSDMDGGKATFTFEQTGTLSCTGDTAKSFDFTVNYVVTDTLGSNATLVVYLSPNNGAIENNAGGNDAAYIQAVESNWKVIDVPNLSGSGTILVHVTVTSSFQLKGGGVLGVFASEDPSTDNPQEWNGKTNSLNCTEVQSVPPSAEQSVKASVSASVPASAEQSVKAGTGTPAASTSNTSLFGDGSSPLPTIVFSLLLLASLGTLAYANVKTVRRRI